MNRTVCRKLQLTSVHQNAADLSCSPTRMRRSFRNNLGFHCCLRSSWRSMRSARSILQRHLSLRFRPFQPFVKCLRTDLKPSAKFADVRSRLPTQTQYLLSKRHHFFHLAPGHSMPPPRIESHYRRCYPCLGTCVTYVPGPYTHEEGNAPAIDFLGKAKERRNNCVGQQPVKPALTNTF